MKTGDFLRIIFVLVSLLVSACASAQPAATGVVPDETPSTTAIPELALPETVLLRIRLVTTSDWTDLFLASGADWLSHELVSADEAANTATLQKNHLVLDHAARTYTMQPPMRVAPFLTSYDFDRLMTQLGDDPEKVMVAASMMLTAPGVPFIYYGEEVGLQGKAYELARRPMQWSSASFAGFSTATPWTPLGFNWLTFNVATETGDSASILSHFRNLIHARNQHAALRVGSLVLLAAGNDALYANLLVSQGEAVLVLVNLGSEPVTDYRVGLDHGNLAGGSYSPLPIMRAGDFAPLPVNPSGGFSDYVPVATIPPYATFILQLRLNAP